MKKIFTVLTLVVIAAGCQKEIADPNQFLLPAITTTAATGINSNAAVSGGTITSDGGDPVTVRGVCWDTLHNPLKTNSHTLDGAGTGTFSSAVTGLLPATTYHIRAYATNNAGTAYGNEITILTAAGISLPTITTLTATGINAASLTSGGNITNDGGTVITERGVCWDVIHNPVKTNSHTLDGTGTGIFSSAINPLLPSTTYYLRAYATNSVGTAYGNEITVTSLDHDIYVGGALMNGVHNVATIWKNGVATALTDGTQEAYVNCIFVANTDVYAGGIENNGTNWVAKIWKNGVATILSDGTSNAGLNSIYVVGPDVYAGGSDNGLAKTWKNGVGTALPNGTGVSSIFVAGPDLYACGDYYNYPVSYALFWKNGVFADLTNRTLVSNANSVYVSGSDVYVGGRENLVATIWKNGVAVPVSNGTNFTMVTTLCVNGTTVHAGGYEMLTPGGISVSKYWKNGVASNLTNGTNSATSNSIFVFGSDVYVCGIDDGNITIWKNGIPSVINVTVSTTKVIYMH